MGVPTFDDPPREHASTWWRWPLVPIAALVAAAAAALAAGAFGYLSVMMDFGTTEGWYFRYVVPLLASGVAGYAYAAAACATAPRAKKYAGTVMVTLFGAFAVLALCVVWIDPRVTTGHAVQVTLECIVQLCTATAFVVEFHEPD